MTLAEQFIEEGRNRAKAETMTLAEQFIEEGRNRAKAETMTLAEQFKQEGLKVGVQQGEVILLKTLLIDRFGDLPSIYLKKLEAANTDDLLIFGKKVLRAQSLHDVFGD